MSFLGPGKAPLAARLLASCYACGAPDFAPYQEFRRSLRARALGITATLHHCRICGHKAFTPELDSGILSLVYADPYFASDAERGAYEAQYITPSTPYDAFANRIAELIKAFDLPRKARIHEFGCGAGVTVKILRGMGFEATGSDWSPGAVAFANSRGNAHVFREDMTTLGAMTRQPLDVVLNLHAIEHVPRPLEMLQAFARLLGPRSLVYLNTNQGDGIVNRRSGMHFDSWYYFPQHLHYFSARSFAAIAARAGLRPVVLGTTPRWFEQIDAALDAESFSRDAAMRRARVSERFENQELEMAAVLSDSPILGPTITTPDAAPVADGPTWTYDNHTDFFNSRQQVWRRQACDRVTLRPTLTMEFSEKENYFWYGGAYIGDHWMGEFNTDYTPLLSFVAPRSGRYVFEIRGGVRDLADSPGTLIAMRPNGRQTLMRLEILAPSTAKMECELGKGQAVGFATLADRRPNAQRFVIEIGVDG